MLYAILCYNHEEITSAWTKEEEDQCMAQLLAVQEPLKQQGKLGPVARLLPTSSATTLRKTGDEAVVIDGPFAETKEQLLGFYVVDVASLDEALDLARDLAKANLSQGAYEIRPIQLLLPSALPNEAT
ncbi:MAG: YciI family protein [Rhizobiaceae bacterium]|nr:YciI family protein [Rhizobiaceae bacterium]